jgi:ribosomal protein S18 acetylase RimI-like enzyme
MDDILKNCDTSKITTFAKPVELPPFDRKLFLQEIKNVEELFTNRHNNKNADWMSFTIHGCSYDQHVPSDEQPPENFTWTTEACKYMPNITNYFKRLNMHESYGLICIKKLKSGGYLQRHVDQGFHTLPVNIAINNPEGCVMHMWDDDMSYNGYVDFDSTGAVELNVNKPHYVRNDGDTARYHIIVHNDYRCK